MLRNLGIPEYRVIAPTLSDQYKTGPGDVNHATMAYQYQRNQQQQDSHCSQRDIHPVVS